MSGLMAWFWSEDVWLPPGYTWHYLTHSTHFNFPVFADAWTYPFAIAAIFIFLRYLVLNPLVFAPLARMLGVKDARPRSPAHHEALEIVFRWYRTRPSPEALTEASTAMGWSQRQVERWLRQRAAVSKTTSLTKFCNLAWEATYYISYTILGVVVLWDTEWLWNIDHCFYGFPEQSLDEWVWIYYMVSLGFYWSMTITHFFQHRRKDSMQLFVHHLVTILLISFSWVVNFVRMGTLVLVVHECGDIPMLLAKICKLCGSQRGMDGFFVVFLILWLCTRVGLYPFWIMRTTLFRAHVILKMWYPIYYILNGLMLGLLVIHIMWTYLILRIVVRMLLFKEVSDVRSSSEGWDEEDDDDTKKET
ncbi:Ceramide synthase 6 [Chionoecetes opilio]|uniref:Ceramide synthase 6 n=1 Tax=Chionoecetes opilio TaxID=41210 RepID=A0A8J4Y0X3_CHIOP|nr:Ceramide synthase 6 [Chionoecetes opilio]